MLIWEQKAPGLDFVVSDGFGSITGPNFSVVLNSHVLKCIADV